MRRSGRFLSIAAAALLALAPALADARPGGGASSGSRGSRSYTAPRATETGPAPARPFDRTMTEPSRPSAPQALPGQARPPMYQPGGFFGRNPFLAGLLGGGLLGLVLGGGFLHGGFAGFLGVLLQVAVIGLLVMLLMGLLRRRAQPAPAGMARGMQPEGGRPAMGGFGGAAPAQRAVAIGPADYAAFEALLAGVNEAWSREDMQGLARMATPEMLGYFRDDFAALRARGWKNETRDVRLLKGDLSEAWSEGARDYATVAMRFSLVDVTREVATGRVTEGDPQARTEAVEYWTFVRAQGGPWQLSAIQQAG